jgi:hypothetical protein
VFRPPNVLQWGIVYRGSVCDASKGWYDVAHDCDGTAASTAITHGSN